MEGPGFFDCAGRPRVSRGLRNSKNRGGTKILSLRDARRAARRPISRVARLAAKILQAAPGGPVSGRWRRFVGSLKQRHGDGRASDANHGASVPECRWPYFFLHFLCCRLCSSISAIGVAEASERRGYRGAIGSVCPQMCDDSQASWAAIP